MQVPVTTDDPALFPIENPNPVFRVTADGVVLFANRASDELLVSWGTKVGSRLPPTWQQRIADTFASGTVQRVPVPCGDQVLELDLVPITARGYVSVYGRNVTEQDAASRAREALLAELVGERARLAAQTAELQRERDLQQTLMENTRASLVYLDRDFNFVRLNAAYEAACRRPRSEMLGRNHFELFPSAENEAIFRQVRDTGEAVEYLAKPFEFADQPWRGVTYWDWTLIPVKRDDGAVDGLVFSLLDVTDRIRAERLGDAKNAINTAISSKHDVSEILQVVLEKSVEALGSDAGGIGLREGDCWVLRYGVGLPESVFGDPMTDAMAPVSALVARERVPIAIPDTEQESELTHTLLAYFGLRSVLALPLMVRDAVIGVLSFNYYLPHPLFSEAEMDFAEKLAVSVSQALENARLLESESRQRLAAEQWAAELSRSRDQLEQAVQERTAELEAIFASLPDSILVGNENGIVRCNQAALDSFGCDSIEQLHEQIAVLAQRVNARYADSGQPIPHGQEPITRALRGERFVQEVLSRHLKTNQELVHRSAAAPILLGGKIIGAVIAAMDITEQKRAQERIAYQATLLENVNDAVIAYDADLRITAWNRAAEEQYGWKADEVMGAYVPGVVGSRFTEEERARILRILKESGRWQGEVSHTRRDGTPIVVEATSMALRDGAGRIYANVTVNRDITERKRTEADLRASREQLQNLSHRLVRLQERERSYVANELYNDEGQRLTVLLLELGFLEKEAGGNQALKTRIERIKQLADGILLDMHGLAVSLRPATLDRVGLAAALGQYADELGRQHGLKVQTELSALQQLHLTTEAETALYRIAHEALGNAVRHSGASQIGLLAAAHETSLTLMVEDNGAGFDVEEAMRCGRLGLLEIRECAEMLGGSLSIESVPGEGTAVYVVVPF